MKLRAPKPPKTSIQGYGWSHQRLRAKLAPTVAAGMAVCARCGKPIRADEPWDLDHDDVDRRRYLGPSHRRCNRATSRVQRHSREW
jgi:hypothetical protein